MTGTMALEDGAGIDFAGLRSGRRARVIAALDEHGIDVLLLGREANARYVAGVRRLWRAVVTPWAPTCLVERGGAIHVLNTWDDGIPPEISHDHLFGLSWNPDSLTKYLRRVASLGSARRIAVDGITPYLSELLSSLAPQAEIVDGDGIMGKLRAVKLPAEIACIRTAVAIAEAAVSDAMCLVRPSTSELRLKAAFFETMSRYGVTCPAFEGTFCATPRRAIVDRGASTPRRLPTNRPLGGGETVVIDAGVLYAGYEGSVGRTVACVGPTGRPTAAQRALFARWQEAFGRLRDSCRPGQPTSALREAWLGSGEPLPAQPIAMGVGLGAEAPIVFGAERAEVDGSTPLQAGMVLSLQGEVSEPGVGSCFGRELVVLTDDGSEQLTRLAHPLAVS